MRVCASVLTTIVLLTSGCDRGKVESLSSQVSQLQSQIDETRLAAESVRGDLATKVRQCDELGKSLAAREQDVEKLNAELAAAIRFAGAKDAALTEKAKELELARVASAGQQSRAEIAERDAAAVKSERDQLKSTLGGLSQMVDELRRSTDALSKERDALRASLTAAQEQAGSAAAQVATLRERVVLVTKSRPGIVRCREELKMAEDGTYVRHGAFLRNHENGRLALQVTYENGRPADQRVAIFGESGATVMEGRISNGAPEGEWTVLNPDGSLSARVGFRGGKTTEIGTPDLNGQIVTVALDRAGEEGKTVADWFSTLWHAMIPGLGDGN